MTPDIEPPRPWYREPWPWVLIAIPALTIFASAITIWLAVSRPDPLVVDGDEYRRVQSGMRASSGTADAGDDG